MMLLDTEMHEPATDVLENEGEIAGDLLDPVSEEASVETPVAEGATCGTCGAGVAEGQEWCLECGAAVVPPRRLPGMRTMAAAGALSLVLLGGAVAASWAAIKDQKPAQQTTVETVAQTTPEAPAVEPIPPSDTADIPAPDVQPLPPADTTPAAPVTPLPPPAPTNTNTTDTGTDTTPAEPANPQIVLSSGAGSLYDPDARATATGDPQRALDGNPGTSWFATTPAGGDMDVGYVIDLGDRSALSKLQLITKTPGFTLTVYGATGSEPPAKISDPKWKKLAEAGSVDGDAPAGTTSTVKPAEGDKAGDRRLVLPIDAGDKTYRQVLLWVTTPPAAGPTVRFSEIKLWS